MISVLSAYQFITVDKRKYEWLLRGLWVVWLSGLLLHIVCTKPDLGTCCTAPCQPELKVREELCLQI